jgi:hypothetical protein
MKRTFLAVLVTSISVGLSLLPQITAAQEAAPESSATAAAPAPPPSAPVKRSAAELEKLAMPIALYPDQLIAVILPASVYPVEVVQAARFVKDTNNIPKVDDQSWDDNVKAVAKFPEVIQKMNDDLNWTVELGQAFLDQSKELMDTIQSLRAKAQKAGNLRTSEHQIVTVTNVVVVQTNYNEVVTVTNQIVQVQPANPQVVYVPTYPPTVYYPPPGYVYNPIAPLVTFGVGMAWGAILANNCNWGHGDVDINVNNSVNRNSNINTSRNTSNTRNTANARASGTSAGNRQGTTQKWQPDQNRMRNSGGTSASTREARGFGSGTGNAGGRPSTGAIGSRPSTGNAGARPSTGNVGAGSAGARPSTGNAAARPSTGNAGSRPSAGTSQARSSSSGNRGSAFSGANSGSSARSASSRGSSSRGGGGFSGGGRGGGGRGGGGRGGRR